MAKRRNIPAATRQEVLMESGYRCAVPTCRNIITIDFHHIIPISEEGENNKDNLIALCPNCHALYHRKNIPKDAIRYWKGLLVALNSAFDSETIDDLLFLHKLPPSQFKISGDGVLKFSRIIAAGLVSFERAHHGRTTLDGRERPFFYEVKLTEKGEMLVDAWLKGDEEKFKVALAIA